MGRRADRCRHLRRSLAHAENSGRPRLRLRFAVLHGSPARRPLLDEKADAPKRAAGDDRRNRPDAVPLRTLGRHDRTGGNVSLLRQTSRDDASPLAADRRENRTAVRHGIPCLRRRADGRRGLSEPDRHLRQPVWSPDAKPGPDGTGLRHPRKPDSPHGRQRANGHAERRAVPTGGGRATVTASSVGNRPEHGLRAGRWRKTHHGPGPAGRLCPHGHGAHTGRIGPAHGIRDAARQSGARLGRTAAARPSDPERSGDPRAMDLCRYGRTVAVGRPLGPDAVGRASGARCLGQRQRLQRRARHGDADAGRPAGLSVRRKLSTLVRRRAVDPVFLSPPLPQASEPAPGARRAVQFAAARRGGPDRHAAPDSLSLRKRSARLAGDQSGRNFRGFRRNRSLAALAAVSVTAVEPISEPHRRNGPDRSKRHGRACRRVSRRRGRGHRPPGMGGSTCVRPAGNAGRGGQARRDAFGREKLRISRFCRIFAL